MTNIFHTIRRAYQFLTILVAILLFSSPASAWTSNTEENTSVLAPSSVSTTRSWVVQGVTEGSALHFWYRGPDQTLVWQKIDQYGQSILADNGVDLLDLTGRMVENVITDNSGGFYVQVSVAVETGGSVGLIDKYRLVFHYDNDGNHLWPVTGVTISAPGNASVDIQSDGSGGIYIVDGINLKRIDVSGNWVFGSENTGVLLCDMDCTRKVVTNNQQGVYVATYQNEFAYVKKIDAQGNMEWDSTLVDENKIAMIPAPLDMVADKAGNVFLIWNVLDKLPELNVIRTMMQRFSANGQILWQEGVTVCPTAVYSPRPMSLVPDELGGLFLSFELKNNLGSTYYYSQHYSAENGMAMWEAQGKYCQAEDGLGLLIDSGDGSLLEVGIKTNQRKGFIQKRNYDGSLVWSQATEFTNDFAGYLQNEPYHFLDLMNDTTGGAVITWLHTGIDFFITTQRIYSDGLLSTVAIPVAVYPVGEYLPGQNVITLVGSEFTDSDNITTHAASQWLVSRGINQDVYLSPVSNSALTEFTIPDGILQQGNTYAWQVRYQDDRGDWTAWSKRVLFDLRDRPPGTSNPGTDPQVDPETPVIPAEPVATDGGGSIGLWGLMLMVAFLMRRSRF